MKKKGIAILIMIFVIIGVSFVLIYLNFKKNNIQTSPTNITEGCNIFQKNNDAGINLVFFATKEQTKKYYDSLIKIKPFDKEINKINFYYIDEYNAKCKLYRGIALLCYNKEILKKASACPNDYIVVIKDEPIEIRSSNYMNVMSLNSNHPETVFAHEFGHAFLSLAEEYVPGKIPKGSKNCQIACNLFPQSCFQECSQGNYYRSVENGIMRTLDSNTFGEFDENLFLDKTKEIPKPIEPAITGNALAIKDYCANQKYYLIQGKYFQKTNETIIINKTIERGCVGKNGNGDLKLIQLPLQNKPQLKIEYFNPKFIFTDAPGKIKMSGETFLSETDFFLKIPIEIENVQIKENNIQIKEISLVEIKNYALNNPQFIGEPPKIINNQFVEHNVSETQFAWNNFFKNQFVKNQSGSQFTTNVSGNQTMQNSSGNQFV